MVVREEKLGKVDYTVPTNDLHSHDSNSEWFRTSDINQSADKKDCKEKRFPYETFTWDF